MIRYIRNEVLATRWFILTNLLVIGIHLASMSKVIATKSFSTACLLCVIYCAGIAMHTALAVSALRRDRKEVARRVADAMLADGGDFIWTNIWTIGPDGRTHISRRRIYASKP